MGIFNNPYVISLIILGSITITTILADTVTINTYPYTIQDNSNNQRLIITPTAIGIDVTNPSYKLQVADSSTLGEGVIDAKSSATSGFAFFRAENNGNAADFAVDNNGGMYLRADNNIGSSTPAFRFVTDSGSTELVRIQGNGNVGIGTSSPSQKLEVNGGIQDDGNFTTSSTNKEFKISAPAGIPICVGSGC